MPLDGANTYGEVHMKFTKLAIAAAAGLAFMHSKGLIHRDLKVGLH